MGHTKKMTNDRTGRGRPAKAGEILEINLLKMKNKNEEWKNQILLEASLLQFAIKEVENNTPTQEILKFQNTIRKLFGLKEGFTSFAE